MEPDEILVNWWGWAFSMGHAARAAHRIADALVNGELKVERHQGEILPGQSQSIGRAFLPACPVCGYRGEIH